MAKVYKWLHSNAIVTLFTIVWMMVLISWVVYRVFGVNPPDIPSGTAAAFATVFGLPALALGLWKWRTDASKNTNK